MMHLVFIAEIQPELTVFHHVKKKGTISALLLSELIKCFAFSLFLLCGLAFHSDPFVFVGGGGGAHVPVFHLIQRNV